jgi:soluble lytic murein transglycosylase
MKHNQPRASALTCYNKSTISPRSAPVYAITLLILLATTPALANNNTAALREMTQGNWAKAKALIQNSRDQTMVTLYEWMLYRGNFTGLPFDRIEVFIRTHRHWPNQKDLLATAERNMPANYPATSVIKWFSDYPPVTGAGLKRYADALVASGQTDQARKVLATSWPKVTTRQGEGAAILRSYGAMISADTNRRRLDYLLFNGDESNGRALAAVMGNGYPQVAEARIALAKGSSNAATLVDRVPASLARDPGLMFERLRWRRKNNMNDGAMELLRSQPPSAQVTNLEDWWKERNILVRRLIEERKYRDAYKLAAVHGQMEGSEYADAEWISGWLSLRFMNDPKKAYTHFNEMHERVKTSISKSRAAYWAGRAAEASGQKDQAVNWYKLAAQYPKAYYGQLAALQLPEAQRTYRPANVTATAADKAKVANNDLVRAMRLAHTAGLDSLRRQMINAAVETFERPAEFKALAEMLSGMGLRAEAVRVAKKAAGKNIFLDVEAYPKLDSYFRSVNVDKALAHALIRQESEFDQYARSPVGALGLMQLMPRTAAEVAKRKGWPHENGWLTSRPEHNVLLGSAYINTLLGSYGGSYPMALAAYNAGGGRVNRWIKEIGDPRKGDIDWVDWIELIPIYETRNYVQRVMESYVVYNDYMGMKQEKR